MKKIGLFLSTLLFAYSIHAEELKPYTVYLRPGAILTKLSNQEEVQLTKGIYAKVLETNPERREIFIVYDKFGKPTYEVSASGVLEIANDVKLLPNVDAEVIFPAPSVLKSNNKVALFDSQFNYHIDFLQSSALNSLYSQELANGTGNRFEVRTMYVSELPVNFGLGLNYQAASWSNADGDELKLSALSLGPQIERVIYQQEKFQASLFLGAEFAPIYKMAAGEEKDKYQAMLFDIGAETLWDTSLGKWSLGAHYRRHDLTLTSTTRTTVTPVPEEFIMTSFGIMVGYKYEWDL